MFSEAEIDALLAALRAVDGDVRLGGLVMDSPRRSVRPGADSAITLRVASDTATGNLESQGDFAEEQAWIVFLIQPYRTDMDLAERQAQATAASIVAGVQAAPPGDWILRGYDLTGIDRAPETDQWIASSLGLRFVR